jgi:hypothetical protein
MGEEKRGWKISRIKMRKRRHTFRQKIVDILRVFDNGSDKALLTKKKRDVWSLHDVS